MPGAVVVPIGFVSDHMEVIYDLDTEAAGHGRGDRPAVRPGRHGRGRPAVRGDGARPAPRACLRRARRVARPGRDRVRGALGRLPRRAAAATRAVRGRRSAGRTDDGTRRPRTPGCCELALDTAREAGELVAALRARGVDRRRHQVQPGRRRHRGRPRLRGARSASGCSGHAPMTASSARRARDVPSPPSGVTWVVDPIDGTVNYLYGLPQYAVSIAAQRGRTGWSRASCVAPARGPRVRRHARRGSHLQRPPHRGAQHRRRSTQTLVATGFSYEIARARPAGPGGWPGCSRRSATSVGRDRARWTCAPWPPASATPTSRRGRTSGTTPPRAWSPQEAGATFEVWPTGGHLDLVVCRPRAGMGGFLALVSSCGFLDDSLML